MAWRIDEAVIRGEIDNRVRGRVTGRVWLAGRDTPIELQLSGNCWRDLAGRRLEFFNPAPRVLELGRLAAEQRGVVGDITASRKTRVPDVPLDQIGEYYAARRPLPWHWANTLYLEWFGDRNGRVVIEAAGFELRVGEEGAWTMSAAEENEQREINAGAMERFMDRLAHAADALAHAAREVADEDEPAAGCRPLTEAEAERLQERSDRLADRISARLEREGADHYERILREELARMEGERAEPAPGARREWDDEWLANWSAMIEAAERNGGDPAPHEPAQRHPLVERGVEFALRLAEDTETRGWVDDRTPEEHPLAALVDAGMKAAAKLGGALGRGRAWPPPVENLAWVVVRLRRVADHLEDARIAAEDCAAQGLAESAWIDGVKREVKTLASTVEAMIAELRGRLADATD